MKIKASILMASCLGVSPLAGADIGGADKKGLVASIAGLSGASKPLRFKRRGAPTTFNAGPRCSVPYWSVTDIDGDGTKELIMGAPPVAVYNGNPPPSPIMIWSSKPNGTPFEAATKFFDGEVLSAITAGDIVVNDLDSDGRVDLLVVDGGLDHDPWPGSTPKVALGTSGKLRDISGAFLNFPSLTNSSAAIGDINSDGLPDIYMGVGSGISESKSPYFMINQGNGAFSLNRKILPLWIYGVGKEMRLSEVRGDGSYLISKGQYIGSTIADFDNDHALDLVVVPSNSTSPAYLLLNDGKGSFVTRDPIPLPPGLYGAGSTRMVPNGDGFFTYGEGNGTVSLTPRSVDLNRDGYLDLVIKSTYSGPASGMSYRGGKLQLLINNAGKGFTDETSLRGAPGFETDVKSDSYEGGMTVADLNADGFVDLMPLRIRELSYESDIFLNDGSGSFKRATFKGLPEKSIKVLVSDPGVKPVRMASFQFIWDPNGAATCKILAQNFEAK